ncbi:MAG TPA: hypothetical protein VNA69_17290 [Thermoanaerobaculia bacterium]|nr:hypothetical protein [Thermoanaerobaculia bacterium]
MRREDLVLPSAFCLHLNALFPPDIVALETDGLFHARFARGKKGLRVGQTKTLREINKVTFVE